MAKKKSKSSSKTPEPAPPAGPIDQGDSELIDELLAHLDSQNVSQESKVEAANVIQDVEKRLSPPIAEVESNKKSGSRAKFEARKVGRTCLRWRHKFTSNILVKEGCRAGFSLY